MLTPFRHRPAKPPSAWPVPDLVRYCLPHLLGGIVAALLAVCGLLYLNVGGIRQMMLNDPNGWIALLLMCFGFIVTFGSVAIGGAIMGIGSEGDE